MAGDPDGESNCDTKPPAISLLDDKVDNNDAGSDDNSLSDQDAKMTTTSDRDPDDDDDDDDKADSAANDTSDSDNDHANDNDVNNDDDDSSSESGSDDDSSSDDDSDSDSQGEAPTDGISDYERLRLERIKRNQERLAALGLQGGTLKPKVKKKPHRRASTEPRVSLEPTRKQSSRSSKKRIDYAMDGFFPTFKSDTTTKKPERVLTPEEEARRARRRKEKKHNDRIPRFVYDEFNRIRKTRKEFIKTAKRHSTKAEREKNYWAKIHRKLSIQEKKLDAIREKEALRKQKEQEALLKEQAERKELDCMGMTKLELLQEIDRRRPELVGILAGHDQEQLATLRKHEQEERELEEQRKRQSLERKLAVIDALDRFPKAMNEALTKLNALLYNRAPKNLQPSRKPVRRKYAVAFGDGPSKSINIAATTAPHETTANRTKPSKSKKKEQQKGDDSKEPPKKKRKLVVTTSHDTLADVASTNANPAKTKPAAGVGKMKTTGPSAKPCKVTPAATSILPLATSLSDSPISRKKKRGRHSLTLPMHPRDKGVASKSHLEGLSDLAELAPLLPSTSDEIITSSINSTNVDNGKSSNKNRNKNIKNNIIVDNKMITNSSNSSNISKNIITNKNNDSNTDCNKKKKTNNTSSSNDKNETIIVHGVPATSSSSGNTAKRPRKSKDARYIGGWMTPRFSKELDRSWLERTKPIDNRPVVLVPDEVSKMAGVSAKKTAVFDLGSYVPQVGDIILYYPSAHKDVLNVYPDTLGSRTRNLLRVPLWARANRDRNRLSKEDQKGKIWWTDEWIESLHEVRKSKKVREAERRASAQGFQVNEEVSDGVGKISDINDDEDSNPITNNRKASLGDYPIICRVEKTHAEFPEDPYAKIKKKSEEAGAGANTSDTKDVEGSDSNATKVSSMAAGNRFSLLAEAEAKNKRARISPQIRLTVMLKALTPIIAPSQRSGLAGGIGLPPNFSLTTFQLAAPLEPFIIPFCWAYASFHTLMASETIWIRRAASVGNVGNIRKSDIGLCGKGKVVDFFVGASTKKSSTADSRTGKQEFGARVLTLPSSLPRLDAALDGRATSALSIDQVEEKENQGRSTLPALGGGRDSVRLMGNMNELKTLLETLPKDESLLPQAISAALESEIEYKDIIPIREARILVDFLRNFSAHIESKSGDADTSRSVQLESYDSQATTSSAPSLVGLILKTLPLRRGVMVAYDSNRRQLHRASSWNLVTLQPTDFSRSYQNGLLGHLEESLREKAILCMKDLINNNSHAKLFVPMVTEWIAPSYYCAVPVGMSFDRILTRLKTYGNPRSCYYTSMESILMDLNLISENCLLYNNPESELVAWCSDIIQKCQAHIKNIIQNQSTKSAQKIVESNVGGKRQALTIPSFLNAPFKGKINSAWMQQINGSQSYNSLGETSQTVPPTWIPQCGESIYYSRSNYSIFVNDNREFLEDIQCFVPNLISLQNEIEKKVLKEVWMDMNDDEFLTYRLSHWLEGTVISVRSCFPKPERNQNKSTVVAPTPIFILELRLHYTQCETNIFVGWKPFFPDSEEKYSDYFLRSAWMCMKGQQIFESNDYQEKKTSEISRQMSDSITKCFDFLKQRCIDGIPPDAVNPDLALENAEHGTASNFDPQVLPSYREFFAFPDMRHGTRGMKRGGYKATLGTLSNVGYMPIWSLETLRNRANGSIPRHEMWMPFPALSLEFIRLRMIRGYYESLPAIVHDISESYIGAVLYLLSEPWTSDRVSIRKIAKYLMSPRGNGKMSRISVKKKSKKKKNESEMEKPNSSIVVPVKKKPKIVKESPLDILSEEEETLARRIFQIRKYHAAAIVSTLEASNVGKIFCLTSPDIPNHMPNEIPDNNEMVSANFTPYQLEGVAKIRNLLYATGRDPCRNQFKFSYRNIYKVKIKCGRQLIAENGHLEMTNAQSVLFEPNITTASLPNGSQMKLRIRCGNESICGEKKFVTGRFATEVHTSATVPMEPLPEETDPSKFYHSSLVGQNHINFNLSDLENNEDLVRTLFGHPGRMSWCVRCQANGESLFHCRVERQHSNPDYDLIHNFMGTTGVDSFMIPWKESSVQIPKEITINSISPVTDLVEKVGKADEATKSIEDEKLASELSKQVSEARENLEKAEKAQKMAGYLYKQAILLSELKVKLSEDFISTNFPFDPADGHYVFCIHCGCAGDLLVCDGCANVSHPKCAGLEVVPEGDWFCHKCSAKKLVSKNAVSESHSNINSNEVAKQVEVTSFQSNNEEDGSNLEREKTEASRNMNEVDRLEKSTKTSTSLKTGESSLSSHLPSPQTNVEPNVNQKVIENDSKIEGSDGEDKVVATEDQTNTQTKTNTTESSVALDVEKVKSHLPSPQTNVEPNVNQKVIESDSKTKGSDGEDKVVATEDQTNAQTKTNPSESSVSLDVETVKSHLPSPQTNLEPNVNQKVIESDLKNKGSDGKDTVVATEGQINAQNKTNPTESSVALDAEKVKSQVQPKEIIGPEMNDDEFEKKESELDKLLTDLILKRAPPKAERNPAEQQAQQPVQDQAQQQVQSGDPLDVFNGTYVREFLSFVKIVSAEMLLSARNSWMVEDLAWWRKEEGMKPLAEETLQKTVSTWRTMVRKASSAIGNQDGRKANNDQQENNASNDNGSLHSLPPQARKFCSYLGITDAKVFLETRTSDLSRKYASWRKKQNKSKLAGAGPSGYISAWKNTLRKASIAPEDYERAKNVQKGLKVRKLFEDGNYYEGQVISGPSTALDEEKGEMVLCWRVKYLDDDEEEFTLEELDMWAIDNNQNQNDGNAVSSLPNAEGTEVEPMVEKKEAKSEDVVSPPKSESVKNEPINNVTTGTSSGEVGPTTDEIADKQSTDMASVDDKATEKSSTDKEVTDKTRTDITPDTILSTGHASAGITTGECASTGNASTGITSGDIASAGNASTRFAKGVARDENSPEEDASKDSAVNETQSIGTKVQALHFARSHAVDPEEDSKPPPKPKIEQNSSNDWDSSPLAGMPRARSADGSGMSPTSQGSSAVPRRNPHRSLVPAPDGAPKETTAIRVNEEPLEKRRRITRNRLPDEALSSEASGRRKSDRVRSQEETRSTETSGNRRPQRSRARTSAATDKSKPGILRETEGRRRSTRGR